MDDGKFTIAILTAVTAIAIAVYNSFQGARQQRHNRYADRLAAQLQRLYGPLHFWTQHNLNLWESQKCLKDAYQEIYIKSENPIEPDARSRTSDEAQTTLRIMNKYVEKIIANNQRMVRLITHNYAYIHPDDAETLQELVNDWNRWKLEDELPFIVMTNVPSVKFYREEFVERIDKRVRDISAEFQSLTKPNRRGWKSIRARWTQKTESHELPN